MGVVFRVACTSDRCTAKISKYQTHQDKFPERGSECITSIGKFIIGASKSDHDIFGVSYQSYCKLLYRDACA